MGKTLKDTYGQRVYLSLTEGSANSGKCTAFGANGIESTAKILMVIHKVVYHVYTSLLSELVNDSDWLMFGLSMWDLAGSLAGGISAYTPGIIDYHSISKYDIGSEIIKTDRLLDQYNFSFADMPGGGLPSHPTSLYGFVQGQSLANALTIIIDVYYTTMPLGDTDYRELFELQIIKNIIAGAT